MTKENQDIENEEAAETEVDTNEVIREAFDEAIADEAEEDSIKMAMIGAGATFKNVTRLYNQFMIDAGLAISKEDRNKAVEDALEGKVFDTEESFESAVEDVMEAVTGSTERSAGALIRAYAKKNELECYAKPKSTGEGRSGFRSDFYEFLINDPKVSKEDAEAFIKEKGTKNVIKNISAHMNVWAMVNTIANA